MATATPTETTTITREALIDKLNEDLAREYQAIIAYVVYSQVLKGAEYMAIAKELEVHAGEELQHALTIAKQIDYLGGMPTAKALPVKQTDDAREMLRADLDNENATIRAYRERVSSARRCRSTRSPNTSAKSCGRSRSTRSTSPPRSARTCRMCRSRKGKGRRLYRPASASALVVLARVEIPQRPQIRVGGHLFRSDASRLHGVEQKHRAQPIVRQQILDDGQRPAAVDGGQRMGEAVDLHHRDVVAAREIEHLRDEAGHEQRHVAAGDVRGVDVRR